MRVHKIILCFLVFGFFAQAGFTQTLVESDLVELTDLAVKQNPRIARAYNVWQADQQKVRSVKSLEDKELEVKVPAGIQQKAKLRLKGHGLPAGKTGGHGDIYVTFMVDIPQKLTKEQKKIIKELAEKGL